MFSNVNKQFLVFLFFLLLSGIFWLMTTLNQTYEQEVIVPVRVTGIPKNIVLTSAETDTVRITVREKGWLLLGYIYGNALGTVTIPFKNYEKGSGHGSVPAADIRRIVEQHLEGSSKITSVKPDRMDFYYNSGERKRVPVRWKGRVIPEELYFISHVQYQPDSVDVYAAPEKLDSISVVYTEPLNYAGFRDTLTVGSHLSLAKNVKIIPSHVSVTFYTDVLTEETIDGVPITAVNMPEGTVLRTFPAKIKVHVVAGASQLLTLRPTDFEVVADYREIQQKHSDKCTIHLRSVPHGISRATLDVKQVDYLLEEE